jgi:hypothetical protein
MDNGVLFANMFHQPQGIQSVPHISNLVVQNYGSFDRTGRPDLIQVCPVDHHSMLRTLCPLGESQKCFCFLLFYFSMYF